MTFGEAAERYLAAQTALRPATVAAYTTAINTHLLPAWSQTRLDHVDVDTVARLVERMQTLEYRAEVERRLAARHAAARLETGRSERKLPRPSGKAGYSAWAIRCVLVPAGRIFDFARRRLNWTGVNPV